MDSKGLSGHVAGSKQEHRTDEELFALAFVQSRVILPMAIKTAVDLGVLEILVQGCKGASNLLMEADDVASHVPSKNPNAADMIDRLLQLLASFEVVVCKVETDAVNKVVRRYGPGPVCKWLTKDENGISMADFILLNTNEANIKGWFHLKDAILEEGTAFEKAHGMSIFEFQGKNESSNGRFNEAMKLQSSLMTHKMLDKYDGFNDVKVLVDVGGGVGETISTIISKYKHITGINFDLPHVISHAPDFPGVKHVGGDMFESVPSGDAIFMKYILHNWSDDHCLKVLKNCYKALPNTGKVIIMDLVRPEKPEPNVMTQFVLFFDLNMMANFGGKERTEKEVEKLAKEAGFSGLKSTYVFAQMIVVELIK